MNTKLVVAVAALVAVGAWVALSAIDSPPGETPVAARIGESLPAEKTPSSDTQPLAGGVGRPSERASVSVPAKEAPGESGELAAKLLFRVRGRALNASGGPLSGLSVQAESGGPILARSDDRGWFEFESEADSGRLASADPAWTTVRSAVWKRTAKIEPLLLVARALDVQGTVQDVHGSPLPAARVGLELPAGFETRFDTPLEASIGLGWGTTAGPDGAFALHGLPSIEGAKLSAVLEGYARGQVDEPSFPDAGVVIVLAPPPKPLEGSLRGRVVDDAGNPVTKARVFLGLASVATDDRGEFALGFARAVTTDRIVAVAAGWRPAILERPREPRGTETGWPDTVELALSGPVLSMRGRVVDTKGEPVEGLRVSIADPSPVGTIGSMPAHSEFLGAGGAIPPQALESESQMPEEDGDNFQDWTMWVGPASGFFHYVTTDAQGEFELAGLDDRRYELALQDPKTCSRATSKGHRAGGGVERIVWEPPPLLPLVAGKLIGDDGKPIAGARVGLTREAFGVRSRVFGGRVEVILQDRRDRRTSGEDGSFEFHDVPPQGIVVNVGGEGIIPEGFPLEKEGAPEALSLRVHQRCSFEVVLKTPGLEFEEIALRDAAGKAVDVLKIDSEHVNAYTSTALTEGRSGVVSASSAAVTLDLLIEDVPVKSVPIQLRAGEVTRIEI